MTDAHPPTPATESNRTGDANQSRGRPLTDGGAVDAADSRLDPDRLRRYLDYAVLGGLVLLGLVAAIQFYLHVGAAIQRWVAPEYRSAFQAAFNLAVLLIAAAGARRQLARLAD